jgi:hypothetical protein
MKDSYNMRIKLYTGLCSSVLLLMSAQAVHAQKGVNSLYSAYGLGDLEERDYSRNFGLGSAGIARKSTGYLNELNPASYTGILRQNFIFDVAIRGQTDSYTGNSLSQQAGTIDFKKLALGFWVNNWWGASAGITPFSSVDYKLLTNKYIAGTPTAITGTTEGTGGINRAYISNGFKLSKNFSVGVSTAFLFGPINTTENFGSDTLYTDYNRYTFNTNFTGGVQYSGKVKDWRIGLGATYRFKTNLKMQQTINIRNDQDISSYKEDLAKLNFELPAQLGVGLSLSNGPITWVADYKRQEWSGLNNKTTGYAVTTGERFAGGIEYTFQRHYYNMSTDGVSLQAGFSYNKSYLVVKNNQIKDISGTIGASIPNRTGRINYYVGLEVGQRGTTNAGLIKENYVNAVFHFSLRDIWFIKKQYD